MEKKNLLTRLFRTAPFLLLLTSTLYGEYLEAEGEKYTYEAAQSHCRHLEGGNWRVPTVKELFVLRGDTASFSKERSYWSSNTTYDGKSQTGTGSEGDAGLQEGNKIGYTFYLQDGDVTLSPLHKRAGVICTNSVPVSKKPSYRHIEAGVKDLQNEIIWMPLEASDKKKKYNFDEARNFCEEIGYKEREWRLPSVDELYGIVDYDHLRPSVDTAVFGVMMNRYYWSDDEFGADKGYVVGFKLGSVATSSKKNRSYVRCVSDLEP
jgi:hypothetical protein